MLTITITMNNNTKIPDLKNHHHPYPDQIAFGKYIWEKSERLMCLGTDVYVAIRERDDNLHLPIEEPPACSTTFNKPFTYTIVNAHT